MRSLTFTALLMMTACYGAPEQLLETPGAAPVKAPEPQPKKTVDETPVIVCDMSKFSFTQEIGCVNDGWVEFCAEKNGAPVVTSLRAISPDVQILEGVRGRAACDQANEYLVSQPVTEADCTQRYGALTDAAWNTLCALSQVPETRRFVPGFAE